jgi:hypothetical protein
MLRVDVQLLSGVVGWRWLSGGSREVASARIADAEAIRDNRPPEQAARAPLDDQHRMPRASELRAMVEQSRSGADVCGFSP